MQTGGLEWIDREEESGRKKWRGVEEELEMLERKSGEERRRRARGSVEQKQGRGKLVRGERMNSTD